MWEYDFVKVEQLFPHNCEPIEVLDKDPVPFTRKAALDAKRLHPGADILPEVISATIELSNAKDWIAQALAVNVAHRIAAEKEREVMVAHLV